MRSPQQLLDPQLPSVLRFEDATQPQQRVGCIEVGAACV
jgi:hypothetical protein